MPLVRATYVADDGWVEKLKVIWWIAQKDARIYFFKGPNLTFGLLLPLVLYWSFALDRTIEMPIVLPGLVAMAILFGAGAIQGVALPLERRTGTIERLLAAPVTPLMLMLGKTLAGTLFGLVLAGAYAAVILALAPTHFAPMSYFIITTLCSVCFSAFGLLLAIPFRDIPQAMPPATVVRIALVAVSGTFVGQGARPSVAQTIARLLPFVYGVEGLRESMSGTPDVNTLAIDMVALALFALFFIGASAWLFGRSST